MYLECEGIKVKILNCSKPTMRNVRGRTWDCDNLYINDVKINIYIDYTWGRYGYFMYNEKWYKIDVWDFDKITRCKTIMKRGNIHNQ